MSLALREMSITKNIHRRSVSLAAVAALMVGVPACDDSSRGNDRWVTTEDTTVDIDWNAVNEAYQQAEGPEDLERRVNEIYAGDEIISIAVHDLDEKTQEVTGFFDQDEDGRVGEGEKVFTIRRAVTGADAAQVQIAGHGPYAGYRSPMWDIAGGMLIGSMLANAFSPRYAPMYAQPYVTPAARRGELGAARDNYRAKNPDKFRQARSSKSGRSYGAKGSGFGGGTPAPTRPRSSGGGRFGRRGVARPGAARVVRLDA
jgi:hypothetical protein